MAGKFLEFVVQWHFILIYKNLADIKIKDITLEPVLEQLSLNLYLQSLLLLAKIINNYFPLTLYSFVHNVHFYIKNLLIFIYLLLVLEIITK